MHQPYFVQPYFAFCTSKNHFRSILTSVQTTQNKSMRILPPRPPGACPCQKPQLPTRLPSPHRLSHATDTSHSDVAHPRGRLEPPPPPPRAQTWAAAMAHRTTQTASSWAAEPPSSRSSQSWSTSPCGGSLPPWPTSSRSERASLAGWLAKNRCARPPRPSLGCRPPPPPVRAAASGGTAAGVRICVRAGAGGGETPHNARRRPTTLASAPQR